MRSGADAGDWSGVAASGGGPGGGLRQEKERRTPRVTVARAWWEPRPASASCVTAIRSRSSTSTHGASTALRDQGFEASDELRLAGAPSLIFLTPPTPNDGYRWQLDALLEGTRAVGRAPRETDGFQTVVVRSTVPPGTCEGLVVPLLEGTSWQHTDSARPPDEDEIVRLQDDFGRR